MKNENKVTIEIRGKENCEQTIFLKNDNTYIMFYNDGYTGIFLEDIIKILNFLNIPYFEVHKL